MLAPARFVALPHGPAPIEPFLATESAGVGLMSASTIVVALNAQLLRRMKLNPAEVR